MPDICHDTSPWVGRTPRSFAASMAGLRQGLAPAAPAGPQRSGGRCRPTFLGSARNGRNAQGKKLWAAPLQQGARGAAVPCQPKPLTRPWVSAVLAVARKEIWQGSVGAFNVGLTHPARDADRWACRTKTWQSADRAVNESAPSRRISVADGDRAAGTDRRKAATGSVSTASRHAPVRPPVRGRRLERASSGQVRAQPQHR